MEKENAVATVENDQIRDYNLDMENFLKYLMVYEWDCDAFLVYHPDKEVANQFLRFIGTYFPQIKDRKELVLTDTDQFFGLSSGIRHEFLNYGDIHYYKRNVSNGSVVLKRVMWVNLLSIEGYSKKLFKDISFWRAYGKMVREYGKNHF